MANVLTYTSETLSLEESPITIFFNARLCNFEIENFKLTWQETSADNIEGKLEVSISESHFIKLLNKTSDPKYLNIPVENLPLFDITIIHNEKGLPLRTTELWNCIVEKKGPFDYIITPKYITFKSLKTKYKVK